MMMDIENLRRRRLTCLAAMVPGAGSEELSLIRLLLVFMHFGNRILNCYAAAEHHLS